MWSYNYTYSNELYHYGVPGMRWGHRKAAARYQAKAKLARDSSEEWKQMSTDQKTRLHGKALAKNNSKYDEIGKKRSKQYKENAKADLKDADKYDAKAKSHLQKAAKINHEKSVYKKMQKNASVGEKVVYKRSTRKKAAKYVVNNNMSYARASEKAKQGARRKAAVMLTAGVGALAVSALIKA